MTAKTWEEMTAEERAAAAKALDKQAHEYWLGHLVWVKQQLEENEAAHRALVDELRRAEERLREHPGMSNYELGHYMGTRPLDIQENTDTPSQLS